MIRILLIDENDLDRQLLVERLCRNHYEVYGLAEHHALASAIATIRPHVILLDLKDMQSYDWLNQIQQQQAWLHVPIVVLSPFAFQADLQTAIRLGASRYLVKPVDFQDLEQVLREEVQHSVTRDLE